MKAAINRRENTYPYTPAHLRLALPEAPYPLRKHTQAQRTQNHSMQRERHIIQANRWLRRQWISRRVLSADQRRAVESTCRDEVGKETKQVDGKKCGRGSFGRLAAIV